MKKEIKIFIVLGIILFISNGCEQFMGQGKVKGRVEFWEGDFMPGPEGYSGTITYVSRKICFFEKSTSATRIEGEPFYSSVSGKLLAETRSDGNGYFEISLFSGDYSVFVEEEEGKYYCSITGSLDGELYYNPIRVNTGETQELVIQIQYKAYF